MKKLISLICLIAGLSTFISCSSKSSSNSSESTEGTEEQTEVTPEERYANIWQGVMYYDLIDNVERDNVILEGHFELYPNGDCIYKLYEIQKDTKEVSGPHFLNREEWHFSRDEFWTGDHYEPYYVRKDERYVYFLYLTPDKEWVNFSFEDISGEDQEIAKAIATKKYIKFDKVIPVKMN